jgi:hypothetical protein
LLRTLFAILQTLKTLKNKNLLIIIIDIVVMVIIVIPDGVKLLVVIAGLGVGVGFQPLIGLIGLGVGVNLLGLGALLFWGSEEMSGDIVRVSKDFFVLVHNFSVIFTSGGLILGASALLLRILHTTGLGALGVEVSFLKDRAGNDRGEAGEITGGNEGGFHPRGAILSGDRGVVGVRIRRRRGKEQGDKFGGGIKQGLNISSDTKKNRIKLVTFAAARLAWARRTASSSKWRLPLGWPVASMVSRS